MTTEVQARCRRVLPLNHQNIQTIFWDHSPWVTGFKSRIEDLPKELGSCDSRIIIVDITSQIVFGPYVQVIKQYHDELGNLFWRKEGTQELFHWMLRFAQENCDYVISHGLSYKGAAQAAGVSESFWQNPGSNFLTYKQFDRLCRRLDQFNQNGEQKMSAGRFLWQSEIDEYEDWSAVDQQQIAQDTLGYQIIRAR